MAKTVNAKEGTAWFAFNEVIDAMEVGERLRIDDIADFTKDTMEVCTDKLVGARSAAAIQKMVSKRKIEFVADLKVVSERGNMMVYEKIVPEGLLTGTFESFVQTSVPVVDEKNPVDEIQESYALLMKTFATLQSQVTSLANDTGLTKSGVVRLMAPVSYVVDPIVKYIENLTGVKVAYVSPDRIL